MLGLNTSKKGQSLFSCFVMVGEDVRKRWMFQEVEHEKRHLKHVERPKQDLANGEVDRYGD